MGYLTKYFNQLPRKFGMDVGRQHKGAAPKNQEERLALLDPRFRAVLLSMYRGEPQRGIDGETYPVDEHTRISVPQGMWFYDLCRSIKPKATLEIGMAYGFSSIYFLAAVCENRLGHHTAIDPFQRFHWNGIGLTHAQNLDAAIDSAPSFRLIEDRSDRASTDLARSNSRFEVIFIDGNHRFDDVLVDFYLYAPLCTIGGHIIFDDMWMSSIQTVAAFVRANRSDFVEIDSGLPNICVFRKVAEDERDWRNFRNFSVSTSSD